MEQEERQNIISLIKSEVIPAIGCTEPIAVALAVAKAKEELHEKVLRTETHLSANILKNSMGVGIPGTGMIGLPIAIALGVVVGKSEYGLEVLKDMNDASLEEAKRIVDNKLVSVELKKDVPDKLFIEAHCYGATNHSKVVICGSHNHIASIELNGELLLDETKSGILSAQEDNEMQLSFEKIYEFSMHTPVDELKFILESAKLNKLASIESDKGSYGHDLGKTIGSTANQYIMGDNIYSRVIARTSSACDVRMAGAMIPVMSNSGSGNQGITATIPVVSFAEDMHKSEEELIRALTLSHLMVIYIKRQLGRLSGLCGVMVAGIGSAAGITYLMGGSKEQISYSIKNMIGNITGVICDGAKPSCAMKVSNAVSAGMISAMMAIDNKVVTSLEGIADEDIDKTIRNLTDIGSEGMMQTDQMVLDIMIHKGE